MSIVTQSGYCDNEPIVVSLQAAEKIEAVPFCLMSLLVTCDVGWYDA